MFFRIPSRMLIMSLLANRVEASVTQACGFSKNKAPLRLVPGGAPLPNL
jgi:hypothetical protein